MSDGHPSETGLGRRRFLGQAASVAAVTSWAAMGGAAVSAMASTTDVPFGPLRRVDAGALNIA